MCMRKARQDAQQSAAVGWGWEDVFCSWTCGARKVHRLFPVHVRGQPKTFRRAAMRADHQVRTRSPPSWTRKKNMVGGSEKEDRIVNTSLSLGVQLLLKRGATLPSSLNKVKKRLVQGQALLQFSCEITWSLPQLCEKVSLFPWSDSCPSSWVCAHPSLDVESSREKTCSFLEVMSGGFGLPLCLSVFFFRVEVSRCWCCPALSPLRLVGFLALGNCTNVPQFLHHVSRRFSELFFRARDWCGQAAEHVPNNVPSCNHSFLAWAMLAQGLVRIKSLLFGVFLFRYGHVWEGWHRFLWERRAAGQGVARSAGSCTETSSCSSWHKTGKEWKNGRKKGRRRTAEDRGLSQVREGGWRARSCPRAAHQEWNRWSCRCARVAHREG